ncbi:MAG TPA: pseudouridine synthase [Polyangiaceae bacterium]|nr:pseudouridine synthase [Polyangiaceae bacterium]
MQERLQKILARAGVASRRAAERLIEARRVRVNGKIVSELGARADPRTDRVELDGKRIVAEDFVYVILHKPRAVMSTLDDPEQRPTVADILKPLPLRLFPIGRLDYQTSGALFMTNDGDFAARLLHPRYHVPKTYLVKVQGVMTEQDIATWKQGVMLDDGITLPTEVVVTRRDDRFTWFELIMREGRNQQIRRMGEATGFPVIRLTRTAFAAITIDGLRAGQWRFLTKDELRDLQGLYGLPKHLRAAVSTHARYANVQPILGRVAPRSARAPEPAPSPRSFGRPAASRAAGDTVPTRRNASKPTNSETEPARNRPAYRHGPRDDSSQSQEPLRKPKPDRKPTQKEATGRVEGPRREYSRKEGQFRAGKKDSESKTRPSKEKPREARPRPRADRQENRQEKNKQDKPRAPEKRGGPPAPDRPTPTKAPPRNPSKKP